MLRIGIAGCRGRATRIHLDRLLVLGEVTVVGGAGLGIGCAPSRLHRESARPLLQSRCRPRFSRITASCCGG